MAQNELKVNLNEVQVTFTGQRINDIVTSLYEIPAKYSEAFINLFKQELNTAINAKYATTIETDKKDNPNMIKLEEDK